MGLWPATDLEESPEMIKFGHDGTLSIVKFCSATDDGSNAQKKF
jgi:hypothetical protein